MYYIIPNLLNQINKFSISPFYKLLKFFYNYKYLKNLKLKLIKRYKDINKVRFEQDNINYKSEYFNYENLLKMPNKLMSNRNIF